ncbi:hypothetical protein M3484_20355 [Pseudomonas sp. GX19020]|uniref:hypothetical protein n=1 Tax=Pseudomonas sp. GX19020 TaxID=2942277 RepID=UPI002018470D|nr:hypothetical protein [Pseudomonas sp. GX19020]MCL4068916.1 hypothetical protein [Pseudomonas sp. GX19020]
MRYLLAFYSEDTSQWRCLDTARLPIKPRSADDLPDALRRATDITLRWLVTRHEFGPFVPVAPPSPTPQILVYALEAASSAFTNDADYLGAWLEMFMQSHSPVGAIMLHDPHHADQRSIDMLRCSANDPLQSADPACRKTMDLIREQGAAVPEPEQTEQRLEAAEGTADGQNISRSRFLLDS